MHELNLMHFIQGRIKVVVGDAELLRLRGIVCDALKNRFFLMSIYGTWAL